MKNKAILIGILILLVIVIISIGFYFLAEEENPKGQSCEITDDCNLAEDEICVNNKCMKDNFTCKTILNKKTTPDEPGTVTCSAEPWLYINPETNECMLRGCGYSPYTSPGEGWIRI